MGVFETEERRKERERQEDLQRLRGLRPIDDDFMRCIFKDNIPLVQKVLRILTRNDSLNIVKVETQVDMKRLVGARSLVLDALGNDDKGQEYNIEIQRADKGAGKKRARYHLSALDIDNLDAGEDFDALPETYVIFITENDIFGKGKPYYRIERMNLDADEFFDDGEHILYINGAYRGDDAIGKLMHDFSCADPNDMNDTDMADISRYYKETEEGVSAVCKVMEDMRNEAAANAAMRKAIDIAISMINDGKLALEDIAKYTSLPIADVQKLAELQLSSI